MPRGYQERIAVELDAVLAGIEHELRTPVEQRSADTYLRLAELHRREGVCWKALLEATGSRLTWLAASAAADRAHQYATRYRDKAAGLLQDSGQLWPAEYVRDEAVA